MVMQERTLSAGLSLCNDTEQYCAELDDPLITGWCSQSASSLHVEKERGIDFSTINHEMTSTMVPAILLIHMLGFLIPPNCYAPYPYGYYAPRPYVIPPKHAYPSRIG